MNTTSNTTAIAPVESDNNIVASDWKPDWEQAKRHFELLGRKDDKTIRFRFIHSTRKNDAVPKAYYPAHLSNFTARGYKSYFVINAGGDLDKDIHSCYAIFYEHDDLDKPLQENLWKSLNLPAPTFQVDTGGKSIHSYWVFANPVTDISAWKSLQSDLLEFSDGDRSIKNSSRVMRMAGGVYFDPETGEPVAVSRLINITGFRYSFEELRATVPKAPTKVKPSKVKDKPVKLVPPVTEHSQSGGMSVDDAIARIEELSGDPSQYNRYAHNFTQDRTDSSKYRGDCPWHDSASGTAFYLNQSGDGKHRWYCPQCEVGGTLLEYHAKIDGGVSAEPPTGKAFLDFIESKFDGIRIDRSSVRSRSQSPATAATSGGNKPNLVALPAKEPTDLNQLRTEFESLLASNPKRSKISAFKAQHKVNQDESKFLDDVQKEYLQSVENEDNKADLSEIFSSKGSLKLDDFLPSQFCLPLQEWAASLSIPEQCILTTLLPLAGHFAGQSEVCLSKKTNHIEPAILFTLISGKSGSGKSTLFKAIARNPLMVLQSEIDSGYKLTKEAYDQWKRLPRKEREEEEEPQIPERKLTFISNFTQEAMHRLADSDPEAGALILSDEFSGILRSQGKYSAGKGSDLEELNESFNGISPNKARATVSTGGNKFHVNICGATQPETLHDLITSRDTSSGEFARFLFCELPYVLVQHELVDSDIRKDFTPMLVETFKRLSKQERRLYHLTPEAFKTHKIFLNEIEVEAFNEVDSGYQKALQKAKGVSGRLALILHLLVSAIAGKSPEAEIDAGTMASGIRLMRFYLAQARKLYRLQSAQHTLTPDLEALLTLATRKGSLTPSDVSRAFSGKRRKTTAQARELMTTLVDMGIGTIQGTGKLITYIPPEVGKQELIKVDKELIKIDKFINPENRLPDYVSDSEEVKIDKIDKKINHPNTPDVTLPPTSGGIDTQISTRELSILSTLDVSEAESESGSVIDPIDKSINDLSTLSTLSISEPTPEPEPAIAQPTPDPLPPEVLRGNLPVLTVGRKYEILIDCDRGWKLATFSGDETVDYNGAEITTGLNFQYWKESVRIVNPKHVKVQG